MASYILGPNSVVKLNGVNVSANCVAAAVSYASTVVREGRSGTSHFNNYVGREVSSITLTMVHDDTTQDVLDTLGGLDDFIVFVHPNSSLRSRFSARMRLASDRAAAVPIGRRATSTAHFVPAGRMQRGLLLLHDYQEGTGQVLTDLSGNGLDGELGTTSGGDTNDPTWATSPSRLSFTTDDVVIVPANTDFETPEVTVMAAVQLDATSDAGIHVFVDKASVWGLRQSTANYSWTVSGRGTINSPAVPDTGWHILVGVAEVVGADILMSIYLDGVLDSTLTDTGSVAQVSAAITYGATEAPASFLEGDIIRSAVFARALQAREVKSYYYDWREQLAELGLTLP